MRSAALPLVLLFACKPIPLDLGDEPNSETTDATSGPITSSGDGVSSTGAADGDEGGSTFGPDEPASDCRPNFADDDCSEGATCCSDDPATVGGKLPNYFSEDGVIDATHDTPIFSNANNALGEYGQCIAVGGFATPMVNGCPVPCNPTWTADRVSEICGVASTCCQTRELDPDKDCVIDPMTQRWRTVTGHDIGTQLTQWGDQHTTNQDPFGKACTVFASENGPIDEVALADCYAQLSVADQRGFCQAPGSCPCREDVCDMKNPGWVPRCP